MYVIDLDEAALRKLLSKGIVEYRSRPDAEYPTAWIVKLTRGAFTAAPSWIPVNNIDKAMQ
jgi:hypothetical protein